MPEPIKISSPETHGFWEIPVLFESPHLMALDKPAELGTVVEPNQAEQSPAPAAAHPALMTLLHSAIAAGKPWAKARNLQFLTQAYRMDPGISGVLLLAKDRETARKLADA